MQSLLFVLSLIAASLLAPAHTALAQAFPGKLRVRSQIARWQQVATAAGIRKQ